MAIRKKIPKSGFLWSSSGIFRPRFITVFNILFGLCVVIFLGASFFPRDDGLIIGSDGVNYYVNLRSFVLDGDLLLPNDYIALRNPVQAIKPIYSMGMAICWLPFFLVAHLIAALGSVVGLPIQPDGANWLYQVAICLGTMVFGYVGLLLMWRLANEFFSKSISLLAVVLLWFGWNIIYYFVVENSMSHCVAMALTSGLIYWWRTYPRKNSPFYWLGLGALLGLAALVRPQDILFGSIPALGLCYYIWQNRQTKLVQTVKEAFISGLWLLAGLLLTFAPQFAASYRAYGQFAISGQNEKFNWFAPNIISVLFSTRHGLFTWHFVVLLAVIGLVFAFKKDRPYIVILAVAFGLQLYVTAAWNSWWQNDSFGGRVFISCAPIFVIGLAALLDRLRAWKGDWPLVGLVVITLVWNLLFLVQYRLRFISMSEAISWKELTIDKITVIFQLVNRVLRRS